MYKIGNKTCCFGINAATDAQRGVGGFIFLYYFCKSKPYGFMETEKMKAREGRLYDANYDAELLAERAACADLLYTFNQMPPSMAGERKAVLRRLLGRVEENFAILPPFHCDYGYNIEVGENFFMNTGCVVLDGAKVVFGDNVFVAPHCGFYTAGHPLDAERRNRGLEYAYPITVGNDVWIGGHVCVLPGVSIGEGSVIGAGSVVTKDVPPHVLAAGNPCRVIREITEADYGKYK